ncbi:MAG: aldehyde ferredoxin oxidoreductase N-terminal domain-containing protein [Candidatus Geothermarchaeales archaeon]
MAKLRKVLYIDLSRRGFHVEDRGDLFEEYLGGTGVAAALLLEECPKKADPLGPENPIIFAVGPLTGLFPLASKTVAMFKSPLTGNLGESHAGGRSAIAIRSAGYGAIVFRGSSETPVYLAIHGDKVYFKDASGLWGIVNAITVGRVIRELEPGSGIRTIMRIGGAGESLVSYASVVTETYRHFGRLGLGAVFGSKKLQAVVVSGKESISVEDKRRYRRIYDEIYHMATDSPLMKKYHDLGTAMNVEPLNAMGSLPTTNLKRSSMGVEGEITGEELMKNHLGRRVACAHCPVACIHLAALREPYEKEPYFYKTTMIPYDYEPIYSLGAMLGVFGAKGFLKLMDKVEAMGLDAISTGVVLAWATEAMERGVIGKEDTMGLELKWGDYNIYIKAIDKITTRSSEFYEALAGGVEHASTKYGGRDYALAFGGNEMPGYHTGPLCYVGYITGSRHSHLDSAGYSYDQKALSRGELPGTEESAEKLLEEEVWRQVLTSLVVCLFSRRVFEAEIVSSALGVVGVELSGEDLRKLGLEILRKKLGFKLREGFDPKSIRLPLRILETETPHGKLDVKYLERSREKYFKLLQEA